MKHRVRIDMSFENEADAKELTGYARNMAGKAVSINEGEANEEISFYDHELCRHDESQPCTRLERIEIRTGRGEQR
ncbi:MAG: hypothetical protein A2Z29_00550 [Chloroflexi bacterium RBG_16_56_11]|nr:MAG: hypothetical protein A2Z29_00550 [Chloroflexi bacterium RBG_16_56_11]